MFKYPCTYTLSNPSAATVLSSPRCYKLHICTESSSLCIYLRHRSMCICVVCVHVCIHKAKLYILNEELMKVHVFALMYNILSYVQVLIRFFSSLLVLSLFFTLFLHSLSTFFFFSKSPSSRFSLLLLSTHQDPLSFLPPHSQFLLGRPYRYNLS